MRASELAAALDLSKGRISQLVADGTLNGCYQGEGRSRVFDPQKCAAALKRSLDPGQLLGNGASTKRRIQDLLSGDSVDDDVEAEADLPPIRGARPRDGSPLKPADLDRYELARAAKAEEDLRAMRLKNGRDEGQYVLASEVAREVSRAIGQEIREVETYIRDTARLVADQMGVDFKLVRQVMLDAWRKHRGARAEDLTKQAEKAEMSPTEREANI